MVRIWEVRFGDQISTVNVEAETVDEAIKKVRKLYSKEIKDLPDDYWISKVELIAEADF